MNFKCYHYDIGRGAYLKPEYFKKVLQVAAEAGYTHFVPYLENMIRLPSMAKASAPCAYDQTLWREFDAAAAEYGIELIPHFNVIGHSRDICAAYPELAGKDGDHELDVSLDCVREWTKRCLEEYCSFSKGRHFLIGGDEWLTPNHRLAEPGYNVGEAWAGQINLAVDVLKEHDRIPLVWHDMLLHYPEAMDRLSKDAIVIFWYYDEDTDYPILDILHSRGFRTIMASGMCNGNLSRRRVRALKSAVEAHHKYNCYGLMMTSWSDGRWEKQKMNIQLCSRLLDGHDVPREIIDAVSAAEVLGSFGDKHPAHEKLLETRRKHLGSDAWNNFPEYRDLLENLADHEVEKEVASYLRYHYAEGPLLLSIKNAATHSDISMADLVEKQPFEISVSERTFGEEIKVLNGRESFVIYPKYSGSLQDYRVGDRQLIPLSLPEFVKRNMNLPGGYRSYSGVGGLRPIWSLGSHHNPCTLWHGPFQWEKQQENGVISIVLSRSMYHVDVEYMITVKRGVSGFEFSTKATNKLDEVYAMFSFNLPISFSLEDLPGIAFEWENEGRLAFTEITDSFFVIPAHQFLKTTMPGVSFSIETDPTKTAGFYTDTSLTCITPDLRGYYRKLNKGDTYDAFWRFFATRS